MHKATAEQWTTVIEDRHERIDLEEIAPAGRVGLVALATDYNLEQDLRRMLPETVEVFTNRVRNFNPMTLSNLKAMGSDIERAAEGILPGKGVDVVIYGCTSGTAAIGYQKVAKLINKSHPEAPVTTPLTAAGEAFSTLGIKAISVLTPYNREINEDILQGLEATGIVVRNMSGLSFDNDIDVTRVPPKRIKQIALQVFDPQSDALFVSCTAFRASLVIDEIEQCIGKPVISSNQALAWDTLRLLQCAEPIVGYGRLFSTLAH